MSSNQQPPNMLYPVANAVASSNPLVEVFNETRAPTADDINYPIQKRWFDKSENKEWILVGFTTNTGQLQADWRRTSEPIEFIGGVGTAGTFPVSADNNGDILLESTDLSIVITGGTNSLDFTTNGSVVTENFTVDAITAPGVNPVTPTGGNVVVGADVVAAHDVPIETRSRALHQYKTEVQYASSNATTNAAKVGLAAFSSAQFSVDANGFVTLAGGTTPPVLGLVPDAFTAPGTSPVIPNASGNIIATAGTVAAGTNPIRTRSLAANTIKTEVQFSQAIAATDATKVGLCNFNSTQFSVDANGFVQATSVLTQDLHWPKYIVGDTSNGANYATIAAAIAATSSGDTIAIQPGTYTENNTLTSSRRFIGLISSQSATTIIGKFSDGGNTISLNFQNISLQTNSDYFIDVSGASTTVTTTNCYYSCTNNTGVRVNNAGATLMINDCDGNLATTGIGYYTGSGAVQIYESNFSNSGNSTTASTTSGTTNIYNTKLGSPISSSGTGGLVIRNSTIDTSPINTLAVLAGGTFASYIENCILSSGTAAALSVSASCTVTWSNSSVLSSDANPITGAGTFKSDAVSYEGTGFQPNVTTRTFSIMGENLSWTPSLNFGGASTGITYSARSGSYTRIGNVITFTCSMVLSSKGSATGTATITGLPYASAATSIFAISASLLTFTGMVNARLPASSTFSIDQWATGGARAQLDDTAFANTTIIQISGSYLA